METFSALLAICAGNSPVPGEFPTQRPVTRSFDAYIDLRPNKQLSKQSCGWWFRRRYRSHYDVTVMVTIILMVMCQKEDSWKAYMCLWYAGMPYILCLLYDVLICLQSGSTKASTLAY